MSEKIRKGNDIRIGWSLYDADEHPYNLEGRNIAIELDVLAKRVRIPSFSVSGNTVTFTYYGKDQKYTGSYALKFIENEGSTDMVTFDTKDAFVLVEHSWLAVDAGETPETIQVEVVTLSSELNSNIGPKGDPGDPAGFGSVTADVDTETGTPSVEVTTSGPDTAKNFHFAFSGLKGQDGQDGMDGKDGQDGKDGVDGKDGQDGQDGASAYEIAVEHGYVGTEEEWLASLHGADGKDGSDADVTAQNIANALGYTPYNKPSTGIPATDIAEGVIPDTSQFITKSVSDLVNYYLKSDTYTKAEVQQLIAAIKQFTYQSVAELPTASASTMGIIYLVPSSDPQAQNIKDEFITIDNGAEAQTRYTWEQIGSTAIDLSGYVTTTALNTALANYTTTTDLTTLLGGKVDKVQGKGLSENDFTDTLKGKLDALPAKPVDTAAQELSAAEQLQARTNIGAGTYSKPQTGIPASDLESGVIPDVSGKEATSNKVTSLSAQSTDTQYPSAKCVYDALPSTMTGAGASSAGTGGLVPAPSAGDNEKFLRGDGTWQTAGGGGSVTPKTSWSNPTLDTNIPSEKLVYDSLYTRGVISQTQTWKRAADGGYDYVMSDLVMGNIPQANIDLFVAAGATFNATTGYFELNGLTDISYEEMQKIYEYRIPPTKDLSGIFIGRELRTLLPILINPKGSNMGSFGAYSYYVESLYIINASTIAGAQGLSSCDGLADQCYMLKELRVDLTKCTGSWWSRNLFSLVTFLAHGIKNNINVSYSPRLSNASILYMIENEAATSAITITLHATAYTRATADADITAALQNHPNVTLASA